jgi:predicted metal-binding membrane protein
MIETLVEKTLRRDRLVTVSAIAIIAALAWVYTILLARQMNAHSAAMGDMAAMGMASPEPMWGAARFTFTFVMWAVMMVAMMLPSAGPLILLYARVGRSAATSGAVFAPTFWFGAGYLLAWAGFSLIATLAQYALSRAALVSSMAVLTAPWLSAAVLLAAGVYQWTPMKDACLSRCRAPLSFIQAHGGFKGQAMLSLRIGLLHGLYCIGCCWLLMTLLFVGGVMNLLWIAALAILVLLEKAVPNGVWVARTAGLAFIAAAVWFAMAH